MVFLWFSYDNSNAPRTEAPDSGPSRMGTYSLGTRPKHRGFWGAEKWMKTVDITSKQRRIPPEKCNTSPKSRIYWDLLVSLKRKMVK